MEQIEIYFQSLSQILEQIRQWRPPSPAFVQRLVDVALTISAIAFAVSLLPLLPAALTLLRTVIPIRIGPIDTTPGTFVSFALLWLASVLLTALFLFPLIWLNDRVDSGRPKPRPPQSLSADQVAFLGLYGAYKELKVYFVSHIDQHVDRAALSLRMALFSDGPRFLAPPTHVGADLDAFLASGVPTEDGDEIEFTYRYRAFGELEHTPLASTLPTLIQTARTTLRAAERFPWLGLDPTAQSILQAFLSFPQKVMPRLDARQDLPLLLSVLEDASKFAYAFLPEHRTYLDNNALANLQRDGRQALADFAARLNTMEDYIFPPPSGNAKEKPRPSLRHRVSMAYATNLLVRFSLWFLLLGILSSATIVALSQFIQLSPDTIATLVVGSSIAGAAALAAFLPSTKKAGS